MDLTILYWIVLAMMFVGIIGAIIPGIPGTILILIAILIWSVATNFANVGLPLIVIFTVLILSMLVDYLAVAWGAKQFGGSKWGQFGAIAGMVLGFLGLLPALPLGGPLFGLLFGAMLGAFIGEFLYRKNLEADARLKQAFRATLGTVVGSIIGNVIEALLAAVAVIIFIISTWQTVGLG